jgi:flagellar hook-basal body complex protein FliE
MLIDPSLVNSAPASILENAGRVAGSLDAGQAGAAGAPSFSDVLGGLLNQVNASQQKGDAMIESLALGEPVDVHQVMMALSEANNGMQLTLQVRNKVLEAYQELIKTPV